MSERSPHHGRRAREEQFPRHRKAAKGRQLPLSLPIGQKEGESLNATTGEAASESEEEGTALFNKNIPFPAGPLLQKRSSSAQDEALAFIFEQAHGGSARAAYPPARARVHAASRCGRSSICSRRWCGRRSVATTHRQTDGQAGKQAGRKAERPTPGPAPSHPVPSSRTRQRLQPNRAMNRARDRDGERSDEGGREARTVFAGGQAGPRRGWVSGPAASAARGLALAGAVGLALSRVARLSSCDGGAGHRASQRRSGRGEFDDSSGALVPWRRSFSGGGGGGGGAAAAAAMPAAGFGSASARCSAAWPRVLCW
ncbi:hypothetical protein MARPO_0099s0022 [Marchantia polymorpha]|uniref:Uncharacterized protein n=1 Tax=Marchantia polymorpha TaxID=3197 RepID=A0A2R6WEV6_MARPO|nr:hypothetical protein MARPO_0099s0022 [Marchantia polymorpha]|eukprot:PTQ32384.1 hypothetical protein MARPO_0099s0022 [Marchantia polymorpha]